MKVYDAAGTEVGELADMVASTAMDPPVVTAFFIDRDEGQLAASWAQIAEIDVDGERLPLGVPHEAVKAASLRPDELSLVDALLDNQVLDMRRRTFVRVQDVVLEPAEDHLVVSGVDASSAALARRFGLGFLSRRLPKRSGDFVPWRDVNLIALLPHSGIGSHLFDCKADDESLEGAARTLPDFLHEALPCFLRMDLRLGENHVGRKPGVFYGEKAFDGLHHLGRLFPPPRVFRDRSLRALSSRISRERQKPRIEPLPEVRPGGNSLLRCFGSFSKKKRADRSSVLIFLAVSHMKRSISVVTLLYAPFVTERASISSAPECFASWMRMLRGPIPVATHDMSFGMNSLNS